MLLALLLLSAAPKPFPLPSPDGKPLAAGENQRTYRIPFRFARVEQFYRERFGQEPKVSSSVTTADGRHVLTLKSSRPQDAWAKAVVREGEVDTQVEITPVLRPGEERVEGSARPMVEFVISRSADVDKMVQSIDHTGR